LYLFTYEVNKIIVGMDCHRMKGVLATEFYRECFSIFWLD
jgi:hypothetical protein